MKKALKIIGKVLLWILILLLALLLIVFIYNRIMLKKEEPLLEPLGQTVTVDSHQLSIYSEGEGEHTLVFLSGSGVPSPILEYRPLYSQLSDEYRIVVIERFGYGFSDETEEERTFETIVRQDREALSSVDIHEPVILCPHSMAGLEALLWAESYPDEVEAIVGLDMALPETYNSIDLDNTWMDGLFLAARNAGIVRLFLNDSVFPEALTQDEKAIYKAITCKTYFNPTTTNEALHIQEAADMLKPLPKPSMPMFLFVSNGTDTGVEKETWQKYPRDFAASQPNVIVKELDCGHMLNREMPKQIGADMKAFIEKLG